mmetsp:Transcript_13613/g.30476  ORF Transcript_13613/g.30476 Transcript_13613/m.30476 type:complete len:111 (-) Transcript_13613:83-415(-)
MRYILSSQSFFVACVLTVAQVEGREKKAKCFVVLLMLRKVQAKNVKLNQHRHQQIMQEEHRQSGCWRWLCGKSWRSGKILVAALPQGNSEARTTKTNITHHQPPAAERGD